MPALHVRDPLQVALVNPVVLPYVPAGQLRHEEAFDKEYLPRPQIVQPPALVVPELVTVPA